MKKSLPKLPRATGSDPGPLKPDTWNALCDLVESLQKQLTELRPQSSASVKFRTGKNGFTAWVPRRKKTKQRTPHYWPTVYAVPPEGEETEITYAVTVTPGWLREMRTGSGDAIAYHEAENHFAETDPPAEPPDPKTYTDKLEKHPITAGQAVYITAQVDANGRISAGGSEEETNPVEIEIADDGEESIQYRPQVDDLTPAGTAGTLRFKLAVLEEPESEGAVPKLKMFLAGDHIHYSPPLPSIKSTLLPAAGIGCVIREWSNALNAYLLRALSKGLGKNTITTFADYIEIRGTKLDEKVYVWTGHGPRPSSPEFEWQDGYMMTGTEVIGDEEEPPAPPGIDIKIPTVVAWDDPDAQIEVTNIGAAGGLVYQVRGNGNNATFSISINGGSEQTLLTCKDGLVDAATTNIDITLETGSLHQWKTTKASATTVNVGYGVVEDCNTNTLHLSDAVGGLAAAASGFVVLTITRDASTRAITAKEVSFATDVWDSSTEQYQVILLARVTVAAGEITEIVQIQFQQINLFEEIVFVNGEYKLVDTLVASTNSYGLPA